MNRRGFICAGCWTVDRIKLIDKWPAEEELARINWVDWQGGGSAHNVGIDLRKLDNFLPVSTIGMLGDDKEGDFLNQLAIDNGLEAGQLHRTSLAPTSYTDVMSVSSTGKRTFFHFTGANDLLLAEHFDFTSCSASILHLGLLSVHAGLDAPDEKGSNGWAAVLHKAQAVGMKTSIEMVSIDPQRNRELVMPCLPFIDYLIVNDHEIGSIAQCKTLNEGSTDIEQCITAAQRVLTMGEMQLVAVHYPAGAVCVTRAGETIVTHSLTVPQSLIKSSVGAGDAFVSGMLYGIHEQWSLPEAIKLGHQVAAISLTDMTTVGGVGSLEQCRAFSASC